jgi:hypothetical protein
MAHKTKERKGGKKKKLPPAIFTPNCATRGVTPLTTNPRIPGLDTKE